MARVASLAAASCRLAAAACALGAQKQAKALTTTMMTTTAMATAAALSIRPEHWLRLLAWMCRRASSLQATWRPTWSGWMPCSSKRQVLQPLSSGDVLLPEMLRAAGLMSVCVNESLLHTERQRVWWQRSLLPTLSHRPSRSSVSASQWPALQLDARPQAGRR
jgi:hypothetical protein